MIRSEEVGLTSKLMEEFVLEAKDRRRSDNGSFGKYIPHDFFSSTFGPIERGRRILVCVVRRHVDESINIVLGDSFGYTLRAFHIDVFQVEVSAPVRRRIQANLIRLTW